MDTANTVTFDRATFYDMLVELTRKTEAKRSERREARQRQAEKREGIAKRKFQRHAMQIARKEEDIRRRHARRQAKWDEAQELIIE